MPPPAPLLVSHYMSGRDKIGRAAGFFPPARAPFQAGQKRAANGLYQHHSRLWRGLFCGRIAARTGFIIEPQRPIERHALTIVRAHARVGTTAPAVVIAVVGDGFRGDVHIRSAIAAATAPVSIISTQFRGRIAHRARLKAVYGFGKRPTARGRSHRSAGRTRVIHALHVQIHVFIIPTRGRRGRNGRIVGRQDAIRATHCPSSSRQCTAGRATGRAN